MNRLQSLAARIAWMPMAVGLASLIVCKFTEWGPLQIMGYGSLAIGVLGAFFVPVLLLRGWPTSPKLRPTLLVTALALTNLPVTFYCAITGLKHALRYRITLHNQGDTNWSGLRVSGGGVEREFGELAPRAERSWDVWFTEDGHLNLHYDEPGQQGSLMLESYVTHNWGGSVRVERSAAGLVQVVPQPGR